MVRVVAPAITPVSRPVKVTPLLIQQAGKSDIMKKAARLAAKVNCGV